MLREITPPTAEPLTLQEARIHLHQSGDDAGDSPPAAYAPQVDDSWVTAKITAARQWCEDFLGYPITDAVYVQPQDEFGDVLTLPYGATELVAVQYLDEQHVLQTLDPEAYYFDEFSGTAVPAEDTKWPAISSRANAVRLKFKGRYAGEGMVPEMTKHAMLLMLSHWYENREAVAVGNIGHEIPLGVEALLRPNRVRLGMA